MIRPYSVLVYKTVISEWWERDNINNYVQDAYKKKISCKHLDLS